MPDGLTAQFVVIYCLRSSAPYGQAVRTVDVGGTGLADPELAWPLALELAVSRSSGSPGDAIERSALIPEWGNRAGELYQVEAQRGFNFKGVVAPQYSDMFRKDSRRWEYSDIPNQGDRKYRCSWQADILANIKISEGCFMVASVQIPRALLEQINAAGVWGDGWTPALHGGGQEQRANAFRLRDGRVVNLVVDRSGGILLLLNPLIYTRGEPVDPSSPSFDFDPKDIVALVGHTKVKDGWLPWRSRLEYYDLVNIAS